jgi:hypothetical protein
MKKEKFIISDGEYLLSTACKNTRRTDRKEKQPRSSLLEIRHKHVTQLDNENDGSVEETNSS